MSDEKEVQPEQEGQPEAEAPQEAPAAAPASPGIDAQEIDDGKVFAILGYIISILCIVPLIQRDNAFSLYHAKQVLLLIIACVVLIVVNVIPCAGQITSQIGFLVIFVLDIIGLVYACKGEAKPIPVIGKLAEQWFKGITKV